MDKEANTKANRGVNMLDLPSQVKLYTITDSDFRQALLKNHRQRLSDSGPSMWKPSCLAGLSLGNASRLRSCGGDHRLGRPDNPERQFLRMLGRVVASGKLRDVPLVAWAVRQRPVKFLKNCSNKSPNALSYALSMQSAFDFAAPGILATPFGCVAIGFLAARLACVSLTRGVAKACTRSRSSTISLTQIEQCAQKDT